MPKTRSQKQVLMDLYKEMIDNGNFVLIKVNRIPAQALNEYRRAAKEQGIKLHILKNNIFAKAVQNHDQLKDVAYAGQLAIVSAQDDIVTALKELDKLQELSADIHALAGMDEDEVKEYKAYEFYIGYVDGALLDTAEVLRLKSLPSKETLLGQLVGTLAAPLTGFMSVLNGNTRNLIYALKDLEAKKA